ncbi:MAG: ABC transporter ATP-binding protein [Rhodospirillales bacterium]|nr:ABC transporter ATP-binding protein [Rhodospirillales bacterium]
MKRYEIGDTVVEAVRGVTLDVAPGEFIAILGHSGSGKSTLLSMIGGLTRPSAGCVTVDGDDIWGWADDERAAFRNRAVGFVFQFASLIPTLTALDNVILPRLFGNGGMDGSAEVRARELLDRAGLGDKIESYPGELSGGQQRRVAICRAFINDPKIVIADEPTGDLDEVTENEILNMFAAIRRERGTTFLMVTHNRDLTRIADRTMEMKSGELR